jgi:hypothetical protein
VIEDSAALQNADAREDEHRSMRRTPSHSFVIIRIGLIERRWGKHTRRRSRRHRRLIGRAHSVMTSAQTTGILRQWKTSPVSNAISDLIASLLRFRAAPSVDSAWLKMMQHSL